MKLMPCVNTMTNYKFDSEKHLHTLNTIALTGTSSVVDVLAKPLTWWASGLAVGKLGWTKATDWKTLKTDEAKEADLKRRLEVAEPALDMIKGMDSVSYLKLLDEAYKAHSVKLDKSAKAGTDLHAELEMYVKWKMGKNLEVGTVMQFEPKIQPFIDWADKNVKKFLWSEAHCYSEKLWCGGISDAGAELNDGTIAIIDFKSAKDAYTGHFIQCAGYAIEIEENGLFDSTGTHTKKIDGTIGALVVVPFGAKEVYPVIMRDVDAHKKAFEAAVVLYRLMFNSKE